MADEEGPSSVTSIASAKSRKDKIASIQMRQDLIVELRNKLQQEFKGSVTLERLDLSDGQTDVRVVVPEGIDLPRVDGFLSGILSGRVPKMVSSIRTRDGRVVSNQSHHYPPRLPPLTSEEFGL